MKKLLSVLSILFISFFSVPITFASSPTPAEQVQSIVYETDTSTPELFEYISSMNWIEEISLARNIPQENQRNYTVNTDKVVGMYDLGNHYASSWKNKKDEIFNLKQKKWAFPYYNMGELDGAVVIFNTEPFSYSIVLDNSNRLLNLMFDTDLLNTVLSNNDITQIQDCKAIFGTYSASPSVIYINKNLVLPVDAVDYNSIAAVNWSEFVEKQSEEETKGTENGFTGGGGIASFSSFTNKQMQNVVFITTLLLFIIALCLYRFKRRSSRPVIKIRRYKFVAVSIVSVMLFNVLYAGISPVKAESIDETLTMEHLPDAVYNAIKSEITEDTELTKDGQSDLYSITTTENDGTKTIFSFQEPIKFRDENNRIHFKSDKVKKSNKLFSSYAFQSDENNITAYLPKRIKDNVLLEANNFKIQFRPVVNKNVKAVKKLFTFHDATEEVVEYADVFGQGTALQYKPMMNGLKENIVLNQYNGQNTFQFYIDIGELEPAFMEGESIPLLHPDTKEIVCVLGQVDARDSFTGDYSDTEQHFTLFNSLKLEKDKKNDYLLTITVDKEFLESDTTVYPVVIDPILNANSSNMKDTTVYSSYPTKQTYYTSSYLNVGDHGSYGEGQALVKVTNMSSFASISPDNLVDVTYHVYEGSGRTTNTIIRLRDTLSIWSDTSVTWNNRPSQGDFVSDIQIHGSGWKEFPLKYLFKSWLSNVRGEGGFSADYGFYLTAYENYMIDLPQSRHFCSSEHGTYKPYVKVVYNAASFEPGVYYIRNVQSGKYMDVNGQYTTSGTNVHQWQFHGGQSQQWRVISAGSGYYYIRPMHAPTRSLDVESNYSSNESNIWIYGDNYTGDSAKWQIILNSHFSDGSYRLICKASGKAAVVQSALDTNGANIFQYTYTTGECRNDDWIFERADTTLTVPLIPQMQSNWCWAASAEMIARIRNINYARDHWDAAHYVLNLRDELPDGYNVGGYANEAELAAEYITNFEYDIYCANSSIYSPSAITRVLRDNSPIEIQWGWLQGLYRRGGHSVVIYGFYYDSSGNLILKIKDPWSPNIGSMYTMSYNNVRRIDNDRVWESFQTYSGVQGYADHISSLTSDIIYDEYS